MQMPYSFCNVARKEMRRPRLKDSPRLIRQLQAIDLLTVHRSLFQAAKNSGCARLQVDSCWTPRYSAIQTFSIQESNHRHRICKVSWFTNFTENIRISECPVPT